MKRLLRLPSTWLGLPILLACGLTWFTYELPPEQDQELALIHRGRPRSQASTAAARA